MFNYTETVDCFYNSDDFIDKFNAACKILENSYQITKELKIQDPDAIKYAKFFIENVSNNNKAAILPKGFSLCATGKDKKAFVTNNNDCISIWRLIGNSEVSKQLSEYADSDYSEKLSDELEYLTDNAFIYLHHNVLKHIQDRDKDYNMPELIIKELKRRVYPADKHRLWRFAQIQAGILLNKDIYSDKIFDIHKQDDIFIIFILSTYFSIDITPYKTFALLDFALRISTKFHSEKDYSKNRILLDYIWFRVCFAFNELRKDESIKLYQEEYNKRYNFEEEDIKIFLSTIVMFSAKQISTSNTDVYLPAHSFSEDSLRFLLACINIISKVVMFLQFLYDKVRDFGGILQDKNGLKSLFCISSLYRDFKNCVISSKVPDTVKFLCKALDESHRLNEFTNHNLSIKTQSLDETKSELQKANSTLKEKHDELSKSKKEIVGLTLELAEQQDKSDKLEDNLKSEKEKNSELNNSLTTTQNNLNLCQTALFKYDSKLNSSLDHDMDKLLYYCKKLDSFKSDKKISSRLLSKIKIKIIKLSTLLTTYKDSLGEKYNIYYIRYLGYLYDIYNTVINNVIAQCSDIQTRSYLKIICSQLLDYDRTKNLLNNLSNKLPNEISYRQLDLFTGYIYKIGRSFKNKEFRMTQDNDNSIKFIIDITYCIRSFVPGKKFCTRYNF